jgi:hypothetical protein
MSISQTSTAIPPRHREEGECAPISLFVYNRPEHTLRTIDALRHNWLASRSDLLIFSDGPKDTAGSSAVATVRKLIRNLDGFKSVTIIERDQNLGLAQSVIRGVSQVCAQFGRSIVLEDDLLTTADFLTFMNAALQHYAHAPRIFSVSGFNYALRIPAHYPFDAFCFYRSSSLGWGTWKDRWEQSDWAVSDYRAFCNDSGKQEMFNRGGEDLTRMLRLQMTRRLDSWAIRWAYTHYRNDALALLSAQPRVFHIGADRFATHAKRSSAFRQLPLTSDLKSSFVLPSSHALQPQFVSEVQSILRPSVPRKVVRFVRDILSHLPC